MSCASGKVEYIEKPYVPEISFPIFPALEDAQKNTDGSVTVSGAWIVELSKYKIRIEETEKNYNEIKALYKSDYSHE